MRSVLIVAFYTLVGTSTLIACSGKVTGVPGSGDPDDPSSPGSTGTSAPGTVDPSAPTASPPATSTPGSPGSPERCFTADLGTMCRDAPDKAKYHAMAICDGAGATLSGLYGDSSGRCSATCCFAVDLPFPPVPGEPPKPDPGVPPTPTSVPTTVPPVPACTYASFGDGSSCIPYADVGSIAQAACSGTGRSVSSVHLGGTCPGGVLFGKAECCGPASPPGPR